jgi:hypothetical protein
MQITEKHFFGTQSKFDRCLFFVYVHQDRTGAKIDRESKLQFCKLILVSTQLSYRLVCHQQKSKAVAIPAKIC